MMLFSWGSSSDWGGNILREHLALRKQLSPALTPICLQGGACPFLPLQGSNGGKKRKKSILFKSLLLPVWFWQTFLCRGSRSSGPGPVLAGSPLSGQGGHIYSPPAPWEHHLSLSPSWSAPCKRRRCEKVKGQIQNTAHQFWQLPLAPAECLVLSFQENINDYGTQMSKQQHKALLEMRTKHTSAL